MIELYTWSTPNGRKASIMLEELGLPYRVIAVDITKDQQHDAEFRKISPNGKIPALLDHESKDASGQPRRLFESGNILIYLAEKTGILLPESGEERTETLGWLFFQMAHLGPMVGQWHWFKNAAPEKSDMAIKRYREESLRLLEVMNAQLEEVPYLGGAHYSIADIACYAWAKTAVEELSEEETEAEVVSGLNPLLNWLKRVGARPAVIRGMQIPDDQQKEQAATRSSLRESLE
ncbi:glutathione S-transferase N-terminal domain-containing protein [Vreelandella rituensis]|uniref:Glutathione S-transferase family protein n=1 Tax=Vreelandella rituensis TaxID=2282306 RepID=A0A368TSG4_9GAMM|nr:glutathione S-transferase N-terminal domain-containing protein [Halomonas rituensis]RCV87548.1 glutathione S-transferase family protein [Halomonas rituensis]